MGGNGNWAGKISHYSMEGKGGGTVATRNTFAWVEERRNRRRKFKGEDGVLSRIGYDRDLEGKREKGKWIEG